MRRAARAARISSVHALAAVAVPVFGIATAVQLGVLGDVWLLASMASTVVAAALLTLAILPNQRRVVAVDGPDPGHAVQTVGMVAADALAIGLGALLGRRLPERAVQIGASALFVIFGVLLIIEAIRGLP